MTGRNPPVFFSTKNKGLGIIRAEIGLENRQIIN